MPKEIPESIRIQFASHELELRASKMIWWPDDQSLVFADSHFGKASTFRKAGIAVPAGTTDKMLNALSQEILLLKAKKLIVVGDFIHSAVHSQRDFEQELKAWRIKHFDVEIWLVQGNHDRRNSSFYESLTIQLITDTTFQHKSLNFCHDPEDASKNEYTVCGHLHPSMALPSLTCQPIPCFIVKQKQIIVPAFGEFTGTSRTKLVGDEFAIAICENMLVEIQHDALRTYQGRSFQPQKNPKPNRTPATTPGRLRQ